MLSGPSLSFENNYNNIRSSMATVQNPMMSPMHVHLAQAREILQPSPQRIESVPSSEVQSGMGSLLSLPFANNMAFGHQQHQDQFYDMNRQNHLAPSVGLVRHGNPVHSNSQVGTLFYPMDSLQAKLFSLTQSNMYQDQFDPAPIGPNCSISANCTTIKVSDGQSGMFYGEPKSGVGAPVRVPLKGGKRDQIRRDPSERSLDFDVFLDTSDHRRGLSGSSTQLSMMSLSIDDSDILEETSVDPGLPLSPKKEAGTLGSHFFTSVRMGERKGRREKFRRQPSDLANVLEMSGGVSLDDPRFDMLGGSSGIRMSDSTGDLSTFSNVFEAEDIFVDQLR
jgi:hypothetical protein